ncbi:transcription termination factor NusA [Helicobacter canis]|uniref:Transcription termination/antitermination protein NusA n=1 Tax=Helicobacter canis NCTC 12740 TaxID=1357399 RepID=V8CJI9_9HELI|nr:transcription termination factor NusA [Helicobacter canis]ETD27499.1 transcription termination factor NusA [Helicobacter canis NCTC 12740]
MEKIVDIIELIACEKGLEPKLVAQVVKDTIIKVAKKQFGEELNYIIEEDEKHRTFRLIHSVLVCADDDERISADPHNFIALSKAKEASGDDVSINDEIHHEISLENMSRNAVNMLFADLEYHIQRTIENQLFVSFKEMLGKLVSGQVIAIDDQENTFVEIQDIRAVLPLKNRIKGEKFKVNDTISCIVKFVRFQKDGLYVELSRTTPKMLEALLEQEVPEIKDGEVIIQKCARIPGDRAKVALFSTSPRIDPIGSSVGTKGVRINAVSRKLNGENIDCIEYSEIPEIFISKALAPAQIISVKILSNTEEEKKAQVHIMSDQKSKAIGKNGVNIRLACMLTGFEIELVEIIKEKSQEDVESNKEEQKVGIDALESLFKA